MKRLYLLYLLGCGVALGCTGCGGSGSSNAVTPPSSTPDAALSPMEEQNANRAKEMARQQAEAAQNSQKR